MDGNPNDFTEITGREIASPEQRRLQRVQQKQRVIDQFEFLLRALETARPEDLVLVEKRAKAVMAVNKAMNEVYADERQTNDTQEEDEMNDEFGRADKRPPYDALDAWQSILERKLHRLAEQRRNNEVGEGANGRPPDRANGLRVDELPAADRSGAAGDGLA